MPFYNIYRREGAEMHLIEENIELSEDDANHKALHEEVICERIRQ